MNLEYVSSGNCFWRLDHGALDRQPDLVDTIIKDMRKLNLPHHKFSLLYNAYTERKLGPRLQRFKNDIFKLHADSGGLQAITLGISTDEKFKDIVYRNQAEYADIGMSFDEVPVFSVKVGEKTSGKLDHMFRYFDKSKFQEYAERSAYNVKRQIEIYKEEKSDCKPYFIVQGNCYDTYMQWADIAAKILGSDQQYLGGIAMAGAALGIGPLEEIERNFYYKDLQIEKNNSMHILACGSYLKILPPILFWKSGVYDKDIHISYDSTTHTSMPNYGRFKFKDSGITTRLGRTMNDEYPKVVNEINKVVGTTFTVDEFFDGVNMSTEKFLEKHGHYGSIAPISAWITSQIMLFKNKVDEFVVSTNLSDMVKRREEILVYETLLEVSDIKSFEKWKLDAGRFLNSQKVSSKKLVTFDGII